MPTIFVASDHRGFVQKQRIVEMLKQRGLDVADLGPQAYSPDDDYPVYARRVAEAVKDTDGACGILICGSAHGISIQSNRFRKIRAVACYNEELARLGREHNDANILCLSADLNTLEENEKIIWRFLTADFTGEDRHVRRIEMLDQPTEQPNLDTRILEAINLEDI